MLLVKMTIAYTIVMMYNENGIAVILTEVIDIWGGKEKL